MLVPQQPGAESHSCFWRGSGSSRVSGLLPSLAENNLERSPHSHQGVGVGGNRELMWGGCLQNGWALLGFQNLGWWHYNSDSKAGVTGLRKCKLLLD